ncbi:MAG TPA: D-amino acid aminotransferase [Crenotrichaceae bacterium]|nr:D-amino acid aminotransferase [Crenotrichaceae bacterium]
MVDAANQIVYLNGNYSALQDTKISVLDRGFLFGDGIYEVIPVYNGHIFHFNRHFTRLENNLRTIQLPLPFDAQQLKDIIKQLLGGEKQESVYVQITRGVARRDHGFPESVNPTVFVMASTVIQGQKHGIACITLEDDRWQHCDIKTIALLPNVLLRQQAHNQNADEAILIRNGFVTEGAASNVFIVIDKQIITTPKSQYILPGVTRDILIELAENSGLQVLQRQFTEQELMNASEIWITSSTKEIVPVIRINDQPVSNGTSGVVWQQINTLFQTHKQTLIQQEND